MRLSRIAPWLLVVGCSPAPPIDRAPPPPSAQASSAPPPVATRHPELVARISAYQPHDGSPGAPEEAIVEAVDKLRAAHVVSPLSAEERGAVFELFVRLRTSLQSTKTMFRTINGALIEIADPFWEERLIELVNVPIASLKRDQLSTVMDQVFWQVTAAEVLGVLRSEAALEPLIKVVLSPFKGNIATTSLVALAHIGAPAVQKVDALVNGRAPALAAYAESELLRVVDDQSEPLTPAISKQAKNAYIEHGLRMLGSMGTAPAANVVMKLAGSPKKALRQAAAATLCRLPRTPQATAAFKRVYAETGVADQLDSGNFAKEALIACAANMLEPGLVGWIIDDALALQGDLAAVMGVRSSVLSFALRAATKDEWPKVDSLFEDVKQHAVSDQSDQGQAAWGRYVSQYSATKSLLGACGDDFTCYFEKLNGARGIEGVKASYMAMLLGRQAAKRMAVDRLLGTADPMVRAVLATAIVTLSPVGDEAMAKRLNDEIASARVNNDAQRSRALKPLKSVALVLQQRLAPKAPR